MVIGVTKHATWPPRKSSFECPRWFQKPYHHYHIPQRGLVNSRQAWSGMVFDLKVKDSFSRVTKKNRMKHYFPNHHLFPVTQASLMDSYSLKYCIPSPHTSRLAKITSAFIFDNLYNFQDYYFSLSNTCYSTSYCNPNYLIFVHDFIISLVKLYPFRYISLDSPSVTR